MYDNLLVKDVMEVFVIDDVADATYFYGATEETNVSQSIDQEKLTAGIGNKVRAILQSSKEVNFSVQNLFHSDNFLAMQSGSKFTVGSRDIMKRETKAAVDNTGSVEITITGTPKDDEVTVLDKYNKKVEAAFATGKITLTGGKAGEEYTVVYLENEASVNILPFEAETYPTAKHIQLHGIAYDPDTNVVLADIYYDFKKAMPDGNVDRGYSKGANTSDTINFSTLVDENGNYGEYYIVPRTVTP